MLARNIEQNRRIPRRDGEKNGTLCQGVTLPDQLDESPFHTARGLQRVLGRSPRMQRPASASAQ